MVLPLFCDEGKEENSITFFQLKNFVYRVLVLILNECKLRDAQINDPSRKTGGRCYGT